MAPPWGGYGNPNASKASLLIHDKGKGVAKRGRGDPTWAQFHAQAAAELFKDRIPLIARKAIVRMEKKLWEQVKLMSMEEV